jgi:hypothetical protein
MSLGEERRVSRRRRHCRISMQRVLTMSLMLLMIQNTIINIKTDSEIVSFARSLPPVAPALLRFASSAAQCRPARVAGIIIGTYAQVAELLVGGLGAEVELVQLHLARVDRVENLTVRNAIGKILDLDGSIDGRRVGGMERGRRMDSGRDIGHRTGGKRCIAPGFPLSPLQRTC